jgi:competence CoiA-like predicted nuclease
MPFTATLDGLRINILDGVPARGKDYRCMSCNGEMIVKAGHIVIPHFAHKANTTGCHLERETREHMLVKKLIYEQFNNNTFTCDVEVHIGDGIADAMISAGHDKNYAIEVQCSPMAVDEYERRNDNYRKNGMTPIWLFYANNYFKVMQAYGTCRTVKLSALIRHITKADVQFTIHGERYSTDEHVNVIVFDVYKDKPRFYITSPWKPKFSRNGRYCNTIWLYISANIEIHDILRPDPPGGW